MNYLNISYCELHLHSSVVEDTEKMDCQSIFVINLSRDVKQCLFTFCISNVKTNLTKCGIYFIIYNFTPIIVNTSQLNKKR